MTTRFTVAPDGDGTLTIWNHAEAARPQPVASQYGHNSLGVDGIPPYGALVWQVLTSVLTANEATVERLCEAQHDAYEAAAVEAGWETQQRSRKPWAEVPEANKQTMRASVRAVLAALADPEGGESQ